MKLRKNWYIPLCAVTIVGYFFVFIFFGENSFIQVHDNLDLFVPHLMAIKNTGSFFSHDAIIPILGGQSRDYFGSEFYLYNILFMIFPGYYAVIVSKACTLAVAMIGSILLAKDILKEKSQEYMPLLAITSMSFGFIPVFPAYSVSFVSIPLLIFFVRKVCSDEPHSFFYLIGIFFYPVVSYFSYFGLFICAYFLLYVIINNKTRLKSLISLIVLCAGYVILEYRLFIQMLFSDTVSIRKVLVDDKLSLYECFLHAIKVLCEGIYHTRDAHEVFILPFCLLFLVGLIIHCTVRHKFKELLKDPYVIVFFLLVLNSFIAGIYYYGPIRDTVSNIVPILSGFLWRRFEFLNPCLWYMLTFIALKKIYDINKYTKIISLGISLIVLVTVLLTPEMYNDFRSTLSNQKRIILEHDEPESLTYREFYSEDLFNELKEDISYNGEYCVAYGLHPGILTYNGISTLDGYLGLYSLEYKEAFRKIVAPALERANEPRDYFNNSGIRAYLFAGFNDIKPYEAIRYPKLPDYNLYIDTDSLRNMDGKYIISRFKIENEKELGITLINSYINDSSPYTIYLYSTYSQ